MEKWKLKSFAKIILLAMALAVTFIIGVFILLIFFNLFNIIDINISEIIMMGVDFIKNSIPAYIYVIAIIFVPILLIYLITNTIKKKNEVHSKDYYRDIESKYTPAIASLLLDYKIEGNEAVLATILDLHVKKHLRISKKDKKLEIEITKENTENLYLHEKYIIDCLKKKELIEVMKFQDKVEEDCINNKLVNKKEVSSFWGDAVGFEFKTGIIFMALETVFPGKWYRTALIINIIAFIMTFVILSAIKRHIRTNKGKELALKFKGLKNFLKDYTLLSERDINYINISDRYLPFSLGLGVANKLENSYIEYNKLISNYVKP